MRCETASIMPNLMLLSMRHMRPKSRMASRPSGVRIRLPGCGSACRCATLVQFFKIDWQAGSGCRGGAQLRDFGQLLTCCMG